MTKFNFKDFIAEEGLDKSKKKSTIRVGWDGRQEEVDYLSDLAQTLKEKALKSFDKFEESRATVVKLEALIEENRESVRKSTLIHEQNIELLAENKKINKALEKIARDLADYTVKLIDKDKLIADLHSQIKK